MTLGICLALALTAGAAEGMNRSPPVFIETEAFTLAWTHSIEKVRWEEDYTIALKVGNARPQPVLHAVSSRVKGSAAGMEPGPGAVLKDGWYVYTPTQVVHERLRLTRSSYTEDYDLCIAGRCKKLSTYLESDGWVTELTACHSNKPGH